MRKCGVRGAAALLLLPALLGRPGASAAALVESSALRDAVTVDGIRKHQRALQRIADANGGTRASGSPGFDQSADYVKSRLEAAGYRAMLVPFSFSSFEELTPAKLERVAPSTKTFAGGIDFITIRYSGSGDVTAPIQAVDLVLPPTSAPSSTSGCEVSDFSAFTKGNVALIQRGTCPFAQKVANAQKAGAAAALIFNEGQPGRQDAVPGTLDGPGVDIPVLSVSFAIGQELASTNGVTIHVITSTKTDTRKTANVLSETPTGRTDRTVVVGAHLDSVPAGPGINDNGSGTAVVLETAEQIARLRIKPTNRIRFAFWGAEELGLVGSKNYVSHLSKHEITDIAVNLNFDMLGSPNFVRFVYDGDGSTTSPAGPNGSGQVERVFLDYFAQQGLAAEPMVFDGRSDYGPFIEAGIPAGGLFSGAEGMKTKVQADVYGGTAGTAYDACYHQACDTFANVNLTALDQLGDAAAHAVLTFAETTSPVGHRTTVTSQVRPNRRLTRVRGYHCPSRSEHSGH
jgi:Zn-dependent M28 family amino/carboxypeptidase